MTREEYKTHLLKKGFVFQKAQKGFPGRGEEGVYTHPNYKYKFYITHHDKSSYGFYTGKKNGEGLDDICPRNVEDTFSDKGLLMWADDSFIQLMKHL